MPAKKKKDVDKIGKKKMADLFQKLKTLQSYVDYATLLIDTLAT